MYYVVVVHSGNNKDEPCVQLFRNNPTNKIFDKLVLRIQNIFESEGYDMLEDSKANIHAAATYPISEIETDKYTFIELKKKKYLPWVAVLEFSSKPSLKEIKSQIMIQ
jgi:hypothetical protein